MLTEKQYKLLTYINKVIKETGCSPSFDEMKDMLSEFGKVKERRIKYNTFRGSRNLRERNIYTNEFLFLLKKEK